MTEPLYGPVGGEQVAVDRPQVEEFPVSEAQSNGYTIYSAGMDEVVASEGLTESDYMSDEMNAYYDAMSDEQWEAYDLVRYGNSDEMVEVEVPGGVVVGVPMGGCAGVVAERLYGDQALWVDEVLESLQFSQVLVSDDPEVKKTRIAWSSCMSEKGYNFDSISFAIMAGLEMRGDAIHPSAEEIEVALSDATCRSDTSYTETLNRRETEIDQQWVIDNASLIRDFEDVEVLILDKSGDLLGVDLLGQS